MFRSAIFKLTLWYLGLVMAISIIFSLVLYNVASHDLSDRLQGESARIYNQFPVFQNDPILKPGADINSGDSYLVSRLIGFNIIVLVTAGFASYALARRTLAPIEEAHEQQKRFTADVSHELRTPLTALKMETEVTLADEASVTELRATLSSNLEEANKLESLINNLLRLSRLDAGGLREGFQLLITTELIEASVQALIPKASERKISLVIEATGQKLNGDRESLIQLLIILLDNAIKYSPNGSEITVSDDNRDGRPRIIVADRGIGIKKDALEHVFDRFYRADASRNKTQTEGFGLGLSIAKMITDVHASVLTLSSQPSQGTTATITFPPYKKTAS